MVAPPPDVPLPERFRLIRRLGQGAMGTVFEAEDRELARPVAIKLLGTLAEGPLRDRFEREARVLAGLRHPGVVRVYGSGTCPAGAYLVEELLVGASLGALPPGVDPVALARELAEAIGAVHAAGILHRDVKPSSVMRTAEGRIVLVDFGLATEPGGERLTASGMVLGTPLFMEPERLLGAPATAASDWWGFGATLWALLEGRPPWETSQVFAVMNGSPLPALPLGAAAARGPLGPVIVRCLSPFAQDRPASLAEVRELLGGASPRGVPRDPGTPARGADPLPAAPRRGPSPWAGVGLVVALALGLGGWALRSGPRGAGGPEPGAAAPEPVPGLTREAEAIARGVAAGAGAADPAAWPGELARLGTPGRLDAWMAAGGRLAKLPDPCLDALARADEAWVQAGLPPPFGLTGLLRPGGLREPWPPLEEAARLRRMGLREPVSGWVATALVELAALERVGQGLDPEAFQAYPAGEAVAALLPTAGKIRNNLSAQFSVPSYRVRVQAPLAPLAAHLRAAVRAVGAAAREPGEARDALPYLLNLADRAGGLGWYSALAFEAPERLLGGLAEDAIGWALVAQVLGRQVRVQRAAGRDVTALAVREEEALRAAAGGPDRTPFDRRRIELAIHARAARAEGDPVRFARVWEESKGWLLGDGAPRSGWCLAYFLEEWSQPRQLLPAPAEVEAVLAYVGARVGEPDIADELREGTLERVRARLALSP